MPNSRSMFRITRLLFSLALLFICHSAFAQGVGNPAQITIKSEVLGEERTILVRTPPGYDRNSERYPVLYMTDGDAQIGHSISTVAFLARNGRIPEMIVVGIVNTDRTRDLTPTRASITERGNTIPFPTSGGSEKFLKFIETELIPKVEADYRTQPYRIFAGHSLGGLFAIYALVSRPDVFNAYIAVSPSLQWDNEYELKQAEEFFRTHKELKRTLYVSLGNEPGDIGESYVRFRELLTKQQPQGFEWLAQQMLDEDHGSVVLRSHYEGLRKIYEGWRPQVNATTGALIGGFSKIDAHYKWLSQKFGYSIQPNEAIVNLFGYQFMNAGMMDDAIQAFKMNVERFPASANVYDSLGEAYERSGKIDLARTNYERAYAIAKERNDPNVALFKANLDRASAPVKETK